MRRPERSIRIRGSFWVLVLLALTVSPPSAVLSVLLGAAAHECGHILLLRHYRVPIGGMRVTALGAQLSAAGTERLSYGREILVTAAGPLVNLLFALFSALIASHTAWAEGYVFAGANLMLCLYNLLPIPPLDGGQILYLAVSRFFGPMVGDAVAAVVGTVCALALLLWGAYLSLAAGSGMFLLLAAGSLFLGVFPRLRLAKGAVRV